MKKLLGIFFLLFVFSGSANALQVVYPKINPVKINASSTFFIGSTTPGSWLKIDGVDVKVSPSGAFAQQIHLKVGVNNFVLTSGPDTLNFSIERAQPQAAPKKEQQLIEYPIMGFVVVKDGAVLRANPKATGINRIAHLPLDVKLLINGEKGNFYRVYLTQQQSGWIAKDEVEQTLTQSQSPTLISQNMKQDGDFCIYEFDLSEKVPFTISEENGLTLRIYNLDNSPEFCLNIPQERLLGYDVSYSEQSKFISILKSERVVRNLLFLKKKKIQTCETVETKSNKLVVKVRQFPVINQKMPLNNIKIVVDAGHGGCEKGAIGCCGDCEKDINLAIAKNLQEELKSRGAHVHMTRDEDVKVSLQDRIKYAKDKDAEILVSIHANALPDGQDPIKNRGTSVYYYHKQAKSLADSILKEMTSQLGTNNDKVRQGSLALVRPTSSVSVLIEVAYMINPDDVALLTDKDFQQKCAKSIADGIEKYLRN